MELLQFYSHWHWTTSHAEYRSSFSTALHYVHIAKIWTGDNSMQRSSIWMPNYLSFACDCGENPWEFSNWRPPPTLPLERAEFYFRDTVLDGNIHLHNSSTDPQFRRLRCVVMFVRPLLDLDSVMENKSVVSYFVWTSFDSTLCCCRVTFRCQTHAINWMRNNVWIVATAFTLSTTTQHRFNEKGKEGNIRKLMQTRHTCERPNEK